MKILLFWHWYNNSPNCNFDISSISRLKICPFSTHAVKVMGHIVVILDHCKDILFYIFLYSQTEPNANGTQFYENSLAECVKASHSYLKIGKIKQ